MLELSLFFELKCLSGFIVNIHATVRFNIKKNSYFKIGPHHIFLTIKLSRYLNLDLQKNPVIERNSYFCHPKNVLLAIPFNVATFDNLASEKILQTESVFQIE